MEGYDQAYYYKILLELLVGEYTLEEEWWQGDWLRKFCSSPGDR